MVPDMEVDTMSDNFIKLFPVINPSKNIMFLRQLGKSLSLFTKIEGKKGFKKKVIDSTFNYV
jgi:hypothetical protein